MQCGGHVVTTARNDGHTIHGFQNEVCPIVHPKTCNHDLKNDSASSKLTGCAQVGRQIWAGIFSNWSSSGAISGVIWDGIWAGGGPNGECSAAEKTAFWNGANVSTMAARQAMGFDNPAICNEGASNSYRRPHLAS
jgi:hypothetical protein